jgi:enoyl-CoA hydratase/carnithine racemase
VSTDQAAWTEEDGVLTVTFTRAGKLNAVSGPMFGLLRDALQALAERDDLRVLVITAEGPYFTAGFDITEMQTTTLGEGSDGEVRGSNMRYQYRAQARHDFFDELEQVEKPVVLAAQGHCMGVGIEMGVSCDFRLAADDATFGLPEVANLALIPGAGGVSRLTRLIGPHWAKWLVMAGETIDAHQAQAIGLVHAVYPTAEFASQAAAFATKLAGQPREALAVAKMGIDTAASVDRRSARDFDRIAQTTLFLSSEYQDRVHAFQQRSAERERQRAAAAGGE